MIVYPATGPDAVYIADERTVLDAVFGSSAVSTETVVGVEDDGLFYFADIEGFVPVAVLLLGDLELLVFG